MTRLRKILRGCRVVAIGESTGEFVTSGWFDAPDLVAVVDWLARRDDVDPSRIGVFGGSVGGGVALRAAAVEPRIAAVIADPARGDPPPWHQNP